MKYTVDKDKLLHVLKHRPALITSVQNPPESFLMSAVEYNTKILEYLTTAQKTDGVYIAWLDVCNWDAYRVSSIPSGVINRLTPEMRLARIKKQPSLVEVFLQVTLKEWRLAVQRGWMDHKYMKIMSKEALESGDIFLGLCKNSPTNVETIPECFCTSDMV